MGVVKMKREEFKCVKCGEIITTEVTMQHIGEEPAPKEYNCPSCKKEITTREVLKDRNGKALY